MLPSQPGGLGAAAMASASMVGDSNIDARRNFEPPHAGQLGSSSPAESEIEYPHLTHTNDPTAASSPVWPASVSPSTSKPILMIWNSMPVPEFVAMLTMIPQAPGRPWGKRPQIAMLLIEGPQ